MKWRNHKLVTFSAVFSISGGVIPALAAMIGSILPDVLEMRGLISPRTVTHYVWFWLGGSVAFWLALKRSDFSSIFLYIIFFVASGGLLHVCEDALSYGGIPIYTPYGRHVGLGLYETDTISEEFTVLGLVVIFTGFAWCRGFLSTEHLSGQVQMIVFILGRVAHM